MRRHAAMLLLAALIILGLRDNYVRYFFPSSRPAFTRSPQKFDPAYERFLDDVDRVIPQRRSVGVVTNANGWPGYFYWYYRALYRLAGRSIVPMYQPQRSVRSAQVFDTDYIVFWKATPTLAQDAWVLHTDRGTVVRNK